VLGVRENASKVKSKTLLILGYAEDPAIECWESGSCPAGGCSPRPPEQCRLLSFCFS